MKIRIVVEGKSDEALLERILPSDVRLATSVLLAGERSNISSVARTLLVKHKEPVILLANANSLDAHTIRDRYVILNELLSQAAGGTPFQVILGIPTTEAIFFEVPEMLSRIFPGVALESMLMFYKARPREALDMLFKENSGPSDFAGLLAALNEDDVCRLRELYTIRPIIDFVRQVLNPIANPIASFESRLLP